MSETRQTLGGRQLVVSRGRRSLAGVRYAESYGKLQEALKTDASDGETLRAVEREPEGDE